MSEETKKCQYCAETIKEEAIVCRFCGRDLNSTATPPESINQQKLPEKQKKQNNFAPILFAVIFLCIIIWAISQFQGDASTSEPTSTPQESAWYACTLFIEKQLDVSFLDAQDYNPSGVDIVADNQYRVKVYYAKLSDTYQCTILLRTDGNWELLGLEVLR